MKKLIHGTIQRQSEPIQGFQVEQRDGTAVLRVHPVNNLGNSN